MDIKLSNRKRKILKLLVDRYIATAEPVSSGEIKEMLLSDVSSATIRSELASLEEMGYLTQPHISSGRIPTAQAYRLYVESLLESDSETEVAVGDIRRYFDHKMLEVEDVVRSTAEVISDATNYTSIVVLKDIRQVKIKDVKLVDLGDSALVVVITDSGIIKDNIVDIPRDMSADYLETANKFLKKIFVGKMLSEAKTAMETISDEIEQFRSLFDEIIDVVESYSSRKKDKVFIEGTSKMLEYPEYSDIEQAKGFLALVDEREKLGELMSNNGDIEISVRIGGDEDGDDKLANCSIVSAKYTVNGVDVGHAGVIGPTRMDYGKVVSVLKLLTKALSGIGVNATKDDDKNEDEE